MRRADLPPHKTATYVLPRWKVVYVSVPKAACTSFKWLIADLQGESRARFHATVSNETGRAMTVHRRARWQHTPMLHDLSDAELEEITPGNGWFLFAVVRHPAARLWSAWQSKLLLREPRFVNRYPDAPWPPLPASTADVVDGFHALVRALADEPAQAVFADRHFLPQAALLRVGDTPYSRIYRTSEIPRLLADLHEHLRPLGLDEMPRLPRSNETPLAPVTAVFTDEVAQVITDRYGADLAHFGYTGAVPEGGLARAAYTAGELAEITRLIERSERIGDLADIALACRRKQHRTARRVATLTDRVAELEEQVAGLQRTGPGPVSLGPAARRLLTGARRRGAAALRGLRARRP